MNHCMQFSMISPLSVWFCHLLCLPMDFALALVKNRNVCPLPPDGAKRNCEFAVARTAKCLNTTQVTQHATDIHRGQQKYFSAESNGWFNRLLLLWWFFYLKYKFMSCILNNNMTYGFEIADLEPMPEAWYCNVRNCIAACSPQTLNATSASASGKLAYLCRPVFSVSGSRF